MISYWQMKTMPLEEAFPNFDNGHGIFDFLDFEWLPDSAAKLNCNLEYYLNRSGRKVASPLVARKVGQDSGVLDDTAIQILANIITMRYAGKWNRVWQDYVSESSFINTIDTTTRTTHGKKIDTSATDEVAKTGREVDTTHMSETTTKNYGDGVNNPRKTSKSITGSYTDTGNASNSRTGTEKVTDKGATLNSVFGFNSNTDVPESKTGPADSENGITRETSYPGENGLLDTANDTRTRSYNNYKDEVTETGTESTTVSFGANGKVDERSFDNRKDTRTIIKNETNSGTDTVIEQGFKYARSADKLDLIRALYNDPSINDFFEVVYGDIDEVLTCPIYC